MSSTFETWITKLRLSWLGARGKAILGAKASIVGDRTVDWATQILYEHLPQYASAASVALIASERQIDQGPAETSGALGARLVQAVPTWARAGSPLGMLLALYYAGFPGAVIVQQNGYAFSLTLPLPAPPADPNSNLVTTTLNGCPFVGGVKPLPIGGSPWWVFDSSSLDGGGAQLATQFNSRFAVLFPGPTFPGLMTTWATATFTTLRDAVPVTWNNPFQDTTYRIIPGIPTVTDGSGGVTVDADSSTKTTTGVTIRASAPFAGSVDVLAYQAGANPFADFHSNDVIRLRRIIAKWKAAKQTCVGIYLLTQGQLFGWPVRTFGSGGTFGPATVVSVSA